MNTPFIKIINVIKNSPNTTLWNFITSSQNYLFKEALKLVRRYVNNCKMDTDYYKALNFGTMPVILEGDISRLHQIYNDLLVQFYWPHTEEK